ncbi:MAG: MFS transporter [Caldilineaceae bacterium]
MLKTTDALNDNTKVAPRFSPLVNNSRLYYGWIILVTATFGMIMTSPGQTYAVSIFIEHFIRDLGVNRSVVSTLYTVGTLVGSFALPFVGRQIDRRGARFMVVIISAAFGLACMYMGMVRNAVMLGIGFVAIRMLGQGSLSLVSTNVINQWWVQRRGVVLGISGMAGALIGVGAFPNLLNWLIPLYGWRTTYMVLGAALVLIMAPVGYFFYQNRPEEFGLLPDGRKATKAKDGSSSIPPYVAEENWTLHEAIRTPIYWVFTAGLASISMLGTGLTFHMVSIFADAGLDAGLAAAAFVPVAATQALTNLGSGFLVERIRLRTLLAMALALQAMALWLAPHLGPGWLALFYGLNLGAVFGLQRTVSSVAWAKYFGRLHLGTIAGFSSTILVGASALGPMPMGIARDLLGSYTTTLNLLGFVPLVLAGASLFVDRPRRREE